MSSISRFAPGNRRPVDARFGTISRKSLEGPSGTVAESAIDGDVVTAKGAWPRIDSARLLPERGSIYELVINS